MHPSVNSQILADLSGLDPSSAVNSGSTVQSGLTELGVFEEVLASDSPLPSTCQAPSLTEHSTITTQNIQPQSVEQGLVRAGTMNASPLDSLEFLETPLPDPFNPIPVQSIDIDWLNFTFNQGLPDVAGFMNTHNHNSEWVTVDTAGEENFVQDSTTTGVGSLQSINSISESSSTQDPNSSSTAIPSQNRHSAVSDAITSLHEGALSSSPTNLLSILPIPASALGKRKRPEFSPPGIEFSDILTSHLHLDTDTSLNAVRNDFAEGAGQFARPTEDSGLPIPLHHSITIEPKNRPVTYSSSLLDSNSDDMVNYPALQDSHIPKQCLERRLKRLEDSIANLENAILSQHSRPRVDGRQEGGAHTFDLYMPPIFRSGGDTREIEAKTHSSDQCSASSEPQIGCATPSRSSYFREQSIELSRATEDTSIADTNLTTSNHWLESDWLREIRKENDNATERYRTGRINCPACQSGFSCLCNFHCHYRIHHVSRSFTCSTCCLGFLRIIDLNRHMVTHAAYCLRCGVNREYALRRHESLRSLVRQASQIFLID